MLLYVWWLNLTLWIFLIYFNILWKKNCFYSKLGEIGIWVSDEQLSKVSFLINVIERGIVICVREKQSQKASFPIHVTEGGIVILMNT